MTPNLERLRTFALGTAVVLILYSLAGVELDQGAKASVFGLPFVIRTPELLPAGLMLVCVYALVRFYYYGMMLADSPQRHRKDLLHKTYIPEDYRAYAGSVIFGPVRYVTTPAHYDRAEVERQLQELIRAFPKVWRNRPTGSIAPEMTTDPDGESYNVFEAKVTIPALCRLAALIQDIDYTAPIWLNVIALALAAASYFGVHIAIR